MSKNSFNFVKNVTVEPAFFLYTITFVVVELCLTNLVLQKKCRLDTTSEPDLHTPCDHEESGILLASEVNSFFGLLMFLLASIFTILAMGWSDKVGKRRRPLIILSIVGIMLKSLFGCVHSYFWSWNPIYAAVCNTICEIISGGILMMTIASQTYVCDVSTIEDRTMRVGLFSASRTVADLVAFGSAGFVIRTIGFLYTYFVCFVLSIVMLVLALVFIKDLSVPVHEKKKRCELFNVTGVVESLKMVFNENMGSNRIIVLMLLVVYTLVFFTTQGENSVQYLFLRHKFHWNESDYSLYVMYRFIGVIIGSAFCSVVLSKRLKVHDALIGIFAGCCNIAAAVGFLFVTLNWHLYVVPLLDIFHDTAVSVSVSCFSKYYTSEEQGRLGSVLGLFLLFVPTCFPIYNTIFQKTMTYFPSAYFLLSAIVGSVVVLLYSLTYTLDKKMKRLEMQKERKELMEIRIQ